MQQNTSEAFEILKQYLIDNYNAKVASGGREIIKRCHICGDSRDLSDAHMYIGMRNGAIVYNCFKCNACGIVDGKFLRDMDCYDPNIIYAVQSQNKNSSGSNSTNLGSFKIYKPKSMVIPYSNNEFAAKKLNYIRNRLGIQIEYNNLIDYKIILNLKDFLTANNITNYTREPQLVDLLDKFFMGFLSMDNSYVIMRRLIPEGKLPKCIDTRYVNYNIWGSNNGVKTYIIPSVIYPQKHLEIHIAEGCFDILSIRMNLVPDASNSIFCAISGKSYMSVVKYFITAYGFIGFTLHIYPDNDIDDREMIKIKQAISIFNIKLFIHRNTYPGEKDFGVPKNRINESIAEL